MACGSGDSIGGRYADVGQATALLWLYQSSPEDPEYQPNPYCLWHLLSINSLPAHLAH